MNITMQRKDGQGDVYSTHIDVSAGVDSQGGASFDLEFPRICR